MKLKVRVLPRSSKNEVVGKMSDGTLKVKLTSPPIDGKANSALIEILSEYFHVGKKQIRLVSGETSKNKIIEIS